jgi:hypothetical protein
MSFINEDLVRVRTWWYHLMVYDSRQLVSKLQENFHISLLGKEMFPYKSRTYMGVIFDRYLDFNELTHYQSDIFVHVHIRTNQQS